MKMQTRHLAAVLATCLASAVAAQTATAYRGPCDASAATALDANHFVVGEDEHNTLNIYRQAKAEPVASLDLSALLATKKDKEADIEGATAIGRRIYWITSHARNAKGKAQTNRQRFFATDVTPGNPPTLAPATTNSIA